jgi:REP element-mobilizing transposase RayT
MRKVPFAIGEFYHIYNRGVDKRNIFSSKEDLDRFIEGIKEFNTVEPIGSIFLKKSAKNLRCPTPQGESQTEPLVNIVCYCANPNHFHFILEEIREGGISEFMKRLGGGYTNYFNDKYDRSGALFQGRFKSVHIKSDAQLLHLSVYVNLNNRVHRLSEVSDVSGLLVKSSWGEYVGENNENMCSKDMILGRFNNNINEYKKMAEETLVGILERRYQDDVDKLLIE